MTHAMQKINKKLLDKHTVTKVVRVTHARFSFIRIQNCLISKCFLLRRRDADVDVYIRLKEGNEFLSKMIVVSNFIYLLTTKGRLTSPHSPIGLFRSDNKILFYARKFFRKKLSNFTFCVNF